MSNGTFSGKVALVTGGRNSSIGKATAIKFARAIKPGSTGEDDPEDY